MASAILLLTWATVAEGELSALAWLPAIIVLAVNYYDAPPPKPPEYIPKKHRSREIGWIRKYMQSAWLHEGSGTVKAKSIRSLVAGRFNKEGLFLYRLYKPSQRRAATRERNRQSAMRLHAVDITCMMAAPMDKSTPFDLDSKAVAIDNCSSRCLTNSRSDFLPGTLKSCNIGIQGVGGRVKCKVKGTVSWTIEDNQGRSHDIIVPDTPLCPSLPHRILSPQHWAQETERRSRVTMLSRDRPSCCTDAATSTLSWGKGRFHKTVALDRDRDVAIMYTKSGTHRYTTFAATVEPLEPTISCFLATGAPTLTSAVVTDDEQSSDDDSTEEPSSEDEINRLH
jgi:hypothetical protein